MKRFYVISVSDSAHVVTFIRALSKSIPLTVFDLFQFIVNSPRSWGYVRGGVICFI